jgi:Cof subfamily protein (haloacid dehalogenase superfamily)
MSILFLSDIDGTLVEGHIIAPQVKKTVSEFVWRGNWFSLATGRNAFAIRWIVDQLTVNAPCIVLTGAALYDPMTETMMNVRPMPGHTKTRLKLLAEEYQEMGIQVFTRSGLCNLRLNSFLQQNGIPEEIACGISGIDALAGEEILKIGLCCEDTNKIESAVRRMFSDRQQYKWHYSFAIAAEIFSSSASKGAAARMLIDSLPERPECIAVAGDSPNDISMFEEADITFAPENAFKEVRDAADYIIPPPHQGGVAQALQMLMKKTK